MHFTQRVRPSPTDSTSVTFKKAKAIKNPTQPIAEHTTHAAARVRSVWRGRCFERYTYHNPKSERDDQVGRRIESRVAHTCAFAQKRSDAHNYIVNTQTRAFTRQLRVRNEITGKCSKSQSTPGSNRMHRPLRAESAAAKAQRSPRGGLSRGRTRQQQTQAVMHERTGQMAEQRRLANHALGDAHQHKWGQVEFERVPGCWQLVGCKTHARQETVLR